MKKLKWILVPILITAMLMILSHFRTRAIEQEVLIQSLSPNTKYERTVHLKLFDPWVSYIPHWRISYNDEGMDPKLSAPSLSIDLFGRVVDWSSKDVRIKMVESGYAEEY